MYGTGVAHSVMLIALVIAIGIQLGKIKIFGVSLGITLVLFVGVVMGHLGMKMDAEVLHFFKEFGLILFVSSVGMQVGPGFFSSFKEGGIKFNMLAAAVVFLGAIITLCIHYITDIPVATMVGIMSGAVTNTPGLGAAQQAYTDMVGEPNSTIAMGYAVAYPLGVVGIISSILVIKSIFKVSFEKESKDLLSHSENSGTEARSISLQVTNPAIFGMKVSGLSTLVDHSEFVVSRILVHSTNSLAIAAADTILNENDKISVITHECDTEILKTLIGTELVDMDIKQWRRLESQLVTRRILVTNPKMNGKNLSKLNLRKLYGINITRINRSGVDLVANAQLNLQLGDRLNVVGTEAAIKDVEKVLGNSLKHLNEPNLMAIFIAIALGILLGSIPIMFPGVPQPVKLGLAGGPLIAAIVISRFGYKYHLITYTTQSANLFVREIGITIFLACVGIGAGDGFVDTVVNGGYTWIAYGFIITVVPLLIVGTIARYFFKINYFTLMGLLAGSTTDPPALAYSNTTAGNDAPAVGYATVYPLTMFLRVLVAQLMILFFV